MTGNITATGGNAVTNIALKNFTPFTRCVTHMNSEHIDTGENVDLVLPIYNLIEYRENYSDRSGSLWQFKRGKFPANNARNPGNVSADHFSLFKYKSRIFKIKPDTVHNNGVLKNAKIVIPLKYLSNFCKSLEKPLVNYKIYLELNWTKTCVMFHSLETQHLK